MTAARTAPRSPQVNECHLSLDERGDGNELTVGISNVVVDIGFACHQDIFRLGHGYLLVDGMTGEDVDQFVVIE